MKKTIAITTSVLVMTFLSTVSAHADRKTVEGFMLGTGIAILTAAIYNGVHKNPAPQPQYTPNHSRHDKNNHAGYRYNHRNPGHRGYSHQSPPMGHWEIEKMWVDPVYEKKWNPGHYNPSGEWVSGRYQKFLLQNGFWKEEKIWVMH